MPYRLHVCVLTKLLSAGNAICVSLCILHVESQGTRKMQDHWRIQAGIQNPVCTSLGPVHAQRLSCMHHCEQPISPFGITTQRCRGLLSAPLEPPLVQGDRAPFPQPGRLVAVCAAGGPAVSVAPHPYCRHREREGGSLVSFNGHHDGDAPGCTAVLPLPETANCVLTRTCLPFVLVFFLKKIMWL